MLVQPISVSGPQLGRVLVERGRGLGEGDVAVLGQGFGGELGFGSA